MHEVFGILTLASTLLLGPSLVSVQFGSGELMGPFGHAVGAALNWSLGLAGYLLIAALLITALRIFAGALGSGRADTVRRAPWMESGGLMLGLLSLAVLLHLAGSPHRIAGASPGGMLGELCGEVLRSLLSTPGASVVSLAGLALALVLSTSLSWARLALAAGAAALRLAAGLPPALRRAWNQLSDGTTALVQALRRRSSVAEVDSGGAAALPPVVRLDLCGIDSDAPPPKDAPKGAVDGLPDDLEIAPPEPPPKAPPRPPRIAGADDDELEIVIDVEEPAPPGPKRRRSVGRRKGKDQASDPRTAPAADAGAGAPEPTELTIVESQFHKLEEAAREEEPGEKRVEPTDGPGFVLHDGTYKPPPVSLLDYQASDEGGVDREAIYRQADRLVKTLADYKIEGRITEVHPGPVVTMYEFVPVSGTRISKVASLAADLAMSLAAQRVRIVAPIPGKGAIGIEVPNDKRETVYFKEIVSSDAFRSGGAGKGKKKGQGRGKLSLALGKNIVGAPVVMDLAKMPHLLVAGATGTGKSVSINAMICSLLMRCTPEEVRLILVDPKFLELSGYNEIPHLMLPVVTDPKKANTALRWAVNEMERRYQLLADMRVRDIDNYNRKVDRLRGAAAEAQAAPQEPGQGPGQEQTLAEDAPSKVLVMRRNADGSEVPLAGEAPAAEQEGTPATDAAPGAETAPGQPAPPPKRKARANARGDQPLPRRLPYIVVVIDEFADLMMVASKEVETSVARLAQKARAAGIHVVVATQRPSVDVITGLIKANFPSRISFQVASTHDSKTILGSHGAENLLGCGDMLVLDRGAEMKRIHGAFISDDEISRVVDWLKQQGRPVYDMDILKPTEEEDDAQGPEEVVDEMYDRAVALVAETRQASISWIQRQLRVGYNRSARMVERMEREGIVGPPDGVRGREVLIQHLE
jgi:S-DNA-T family DNA segregation ATPase FtsK/SpoIIIE